MSASDGSGYHCLIGSNGVPVTLPVDRHFFIGRSAGNDIIVDDTRSSRRHCELYWDGNHFIMMDLGSSNGTFVNDKETTTCTLNDGDVISIGFRKYTYRCVADKSDISGSAKEARRQSQQMVTQELPAIDATLPTQGDFNGTLATMSISDLCQFLNLSRRDGLLLVKSSQGRALIYFVAGEAIQAECGNNHGDEAIMLLLKESKGHFSFKVNQKPLERNVNTPLTSLLLEAARLQDEAGAPDPNKSTQDNFPFA